MALLVVISGRPGTLCAQADCSFNLGPDTLLCPGDSVRLRGPINAWSWTWWDGAEQYQRWVSSTGTYYGTAVYNSLQNDIVVNGGFEDGDTGFTTSLTLGSPGPWGLLSDEGTYVITTSGRDAHDNFAACSGRGGSGNFMAINGTGVADAPIWCQTVVVEPGREYAFSAWVVTLVAEAPAILHFSINGVDVGAPLTAPITTCDWRRFYAVWNSGAATTAEICITNQNLAPSGNDFGLDDITFAPFCVYTDTVHVVVPDPLPLIELGPDTALCPGHTAFLQVEHDTAGWPFDDLRYSWSTGDSVLGIAIGGPGHYVIRATGTCVDMEAWRDYLPDTCGGWVVMPNVFSPNGDGVNDRFGPMASGHVLAFSMEIYNRWGQLLFVGDNVNAFWDGRVEGGTVPDGTYFWTIRYTTPNERNEPEDQEERGHVTLLGGGRK